MNKLVCIGLILLTLFIWSCSNNENRTVSTYDLLNTKNEIELKFSDLVDDIKIVPLETGDSILISDCQYLLDNKYIIAIDKKAIHQFDAVSGKHIRILAIEGNGPNEFSYINSAAIKNGKLFYASSGKSYISVIDLVSGKPLPQLSSTYNNGVSFSGVTDNENIYVPNDSMLFEIFSFDNQKATPIVDTSRMIIHRDNNSVWSMNFITGGNAFVQDKKGEFFYNAKYSDTLYCNIGGKVIPYATFPIEDEKKMKPSNGLPNGNDLKIGIPYIDSRMILCNLWGLLFKSTSTSMSVNIKSQGLYMINRETNVVSRVSKYIFDPLFVKEFTNDKDSEDGSDVINSTVFGFLNNWFSDKDIYVKAISAYEVKEYIKASLEDKDFPKEKLSELQALDSKITDDGNPIVFIGKKK